MCAVPTTGLKSSLTIYLNMKQAFLTTRSCCPAPPARDMLTLALSALLHERGRNGELQSKSESEGEYPSGLGSRRPRGRRWRHASGMQHPRGSLLLRGRGARGAAATTTATHQPRHSPPRVGCTRVFKLRGPNPCAHPSSLTSIPMGKRSHHSPAQPPQWQGATQATAQEGAELSPMGCILLWVGLTAKREARPFTSG